MKHAIFCPVCRAPATHRGSTEHKELYKCSRGHSTAMPAMPGARRTDPETSHLAAASMVEGAGTQRRRILRHLEIGPMTADTLDQVIGWRITTAGRRLPELREMGRVRMLANTETTRTGRQARLWELIQ